jgi:competence ComEA-like helix-hairpin-helix protein
MRIVKFRDTKGGYRTLEELQKVYGMRANIYEELLQNTFLVPPKKEVKPELSITTIEINTADEEEWAQLKGIGATLSKRIVKYRDAIGGFKTVADLKKIYGLSLDTYESILPRLTIDESLLSQESDSKSMEMLDPEVEGGNEAGTEINKIANDFDINTVLASELQQLEHIDTFTAIRIVKYRDQLGGFAHKDQLSRVYKIKPEQIESLLQSVIIKSPHQRVDINSLTFKQMLRMDILEYEEVKYIFQLKNSRGKISSAEELRQLQGIPKDKLEEFLAYIEFIDNQETTLNHE